MTRSKTLVHLTLTSFSWFGDKHCVFMIRKDSLSETMNYNRPACTWCTCIGGSRGPGPPFRGKNLVDYIGNHWSMTGAGPPLMKSSGSATDMICKCCNVGLNEDFCLTGFIWPCDPGLILFFIGQHFVFLLGLFLRFIWYM